MLIARQRSCLLIVDVQQGLISAMSEPRRVYRGCGLLMRAAARLDIPMLITEQYPKGLGPTAGELLDLAPAGTPVMEKIHFSCADDDAMRALVTGLGRPQLVIAGIEAHVCVLQTALRFKELGFDPVVVSDACSSRVEANHQAAMARMAGHGVQIATVEMLVFEWLNRAGTPEFKDLSALIK